jgi:hypothetical protein
VVVLRVDDVGDNGEPALATALAAALGDIP